MTQSLTYSELKAENNSGDEKLQYEILMTLVIILLYLCFSHLIDVKKVAFLHESGVAIMLGVLFGLIIYLFEVYILPPIIFAAGYTLRRRNFISNLPSILMLGILGTFISMSIFTAMIIWMNDWDFSMILAAVLCATDTVAALSILKEKEFPQLNAILFGEGIVNDAVSILIFETIQRQFGRRTLRFYQRDENLSISQHEIWMAILRFVYLSTARIVIGLLSALITKRITTLKEHPVREIIMIFIVAYLSYIVSEILDFSGIMTLFCCGFTMNHYTYYNLSEESKSGGVLAIQTVSSCAEAFLFAYLGFSVFSVSSDNYSIVFMTELLLITVVARFFSILIPLSILWIFRRGVDWKTAVFIWYGGLIRGAIAYALTFRIDRTLSKNPQLIRFRNMSVETFDDQLMDENQLSIEEPEKQVHQPLRRIQSQRIVVMQDLSNQPNQTQGLTANESRVTSKNKDLSIQKQNKYNLYFYIGFNIMKRFFGGSLEKEDKRKYNLPIHYDYLEEVDEELSNEIPNIASEVSVNGSYINNQNSNNLNINLLDIDGYQPTGIMKVQDQDISIQSDRETGVKQEYGTLNCHDEDDTPYFKENPEEAKLQADFFNYVGESNNIVSTNQFYATAAVVTNGNGQNVNDHNPQIQNQTLLQSYLEVCNGNQGQNGNLVDNEYDDQEYWNMQNNNNNIYPLTHNNNNQNSNNQNQ